MSVSVSTHQPAPPLPLGASSVDEARKRARILRRLLVAWDKNTRSPGKHGGVLGGLTGQVILGAMIDRWNPETGRLDPSQKTIAEDTGKSLRTVRSTLARLATLRIFTREPRWRYPHSRNKSLQPSRLTDEYTLQPETHWKGYTSRNHADAPDPLAGDLWGAPSPVLSPIDQAVQETDLQTQVALLDLSQPIGESGVVPKALAGLGHAMLGTPTAAPEQPGPLTRAYREAVEASEAGRMPREDAPQFALAAAPAPAAPADDPEPGLRAELERLADETHRVARMGAAQQAQANLAAIAAKLTAARQNQRNPT